MPGILDQIKNAIINGQIAENPSVMTASGWQILNNQPRLLRNRDTDLLASNLATLGVGTTALPLMPSFIANPISTSVSLGLSAAGSKVGYDISGKFTNNPVIRGLAGFAGGLIGGGLYPYGKGVYNRYLEANIPIATNELTTQFIKRKFPLRDGRYRVGNDFDPSIKVVDENPTVRIGKTKGGLEIEHSENSPVVATHIAPDVYRTYDNTGAPFGRFWTKPSPGAARQYLSMLKEAPIGFSASSSTSARAVPHLIQATTRKGKLGWYLTGKLPKHSIEGVPGYSTDVGEQMMKLQTKNQATILPSKTTLMTGSNTFGRSYKEYEPYLGKVPLEEDGYTFMFKNFSKQQINNWNKHVAPKTGMYVDPVTRTAKQYILIKK